MSNEIPRFLRVVENVPVSMAPEGLPRPEVGVGQIWVVRPDEGPDVLVLITELGPGHVQALLCTEGDEDLATETDAVLEPRQTRFPHRLLVHGDLAASVLTRRLVGSPGRIDPSLVRRIILRGRGLDFYSRDLGRDTALLDEPDPRWEAKEQRFRELRAVRASASGLGVTIAKLDDVRP